MSTPTPQQIARTRNDAGLTQTQAAALLHKNLRTWQKWEGGDVPMDAAYWELFNLKIKKERK